LRGLLLVACEKETLALELAIVLHSSAAKITLKEFCNLAIHRPNKERNADNAFKINLIRQCTGGRRKNIVFGNTSAHLNAGEYISFV